MRLLEYFNREAESFQQGNQSLLEKGNAITGPK